MQRLSVIVVFLAFMFAGCRGTESENPPIHPNLNMDFQARFDPQEANEFFADRRAMRPPVPGTIARGLLRADARFYNGQTEGGQFVTEVPVPVTEALLRRGQERYNIYCAVCHGLSGDGRGIVTTGGYGYTPAPTYHDDRLRQVEDGYLYSVIVNGVRTMPSYAAQVEVADRWAIVAYIRALQRSQYGTQADVPAQILPTLQQVGTGSTADGQATGDTTEAGTPGAATSQTNAPATQGQ